MSAIIRPGRAVLLHLAHAVVTITLSEIYHCLHRSYRMRFKCLSLTMCWHRLVFRQQPWRSAVMIVSHQLTSVIPGPPKQPSKSQPRNRIHPKRTSPYMASYDTEHRNWPKIPDMFGSRAAYAATATQLAHRLDQLARCLTFLSSMPTKRNARQEILAFSTIHHVVRRPHASKYYPIGIPGDGFPSQ